MSKPLFLMCFPTYYSIRYSINYWMDTKNQSNNNRAVEQWKRLNNKLLEIGCDVLCINQWKDVPDMVFVANAGFIHPHYSDSVILSKFLHKERQKEEAYFEDIFKNILSFRVIKQPYPFEGCGDCLRFCDKYVICGHGFRSSLEFYHRHIPYGVFLELKDPRFYHLDTCFCPLDGKDYLIYEEAFTKESIKKLNLLGGNKIPVSEEDAIRFACNSVCVGKDVIMPSGCNDTKRKLEKLGYKVHFVEMDEFIKAGGACKCLTLRIR